MYSQSGDQLQNDLAKFGYRPDEKVENLRTFFQKIGYLLETCQRNPQIFIRKISPKSGELGLECTLVPSLLLGSPNHELSF
jgi:hypothetical protein